MKDLKLALILAAVFFTLFVWVSAQQTQKETPKKEELPTAFQTRCSVCHSLSAVRSGMERMIDEMHKKAGVKISETSLKEVEETFTLLPVDDPHKERFQEKCGTCHSLDKVVSAHQTKTDDEMTKTIERMANKETSGIGKDEIQRIHDSMKMLNEIYEPDIELKPKPEKKSNR